MNSLVCRQVGVEGRNNEGKAVRARETKHEPGGKRLSLADASGVHLESGAVKTLRSFPNGMTTAIGKPIDSDEIETIGRRRDIRHHAMHDPEYNTNVLVGLCNGANGRSHLATNTDHRRPRVG